MNDDLISRKELRKAFKKCPVFTEVYLYYARQIIDSTPTVEPCYQTTSCLDCKMYDKENHHCPRFCEVIKELVKEVEND